MSETVRGFAYARNVDEHEIERLHDHEIKQVQTAYRLERDMRVRQEKLARARAQHIARLERKLRHRRQQMRRFQEWKRSLWPATKRLIVAQFWAEGPRVGGSETLRGQRREKEVARGDR